ncbi:hypothetical protein BDA96_06G120300 [Sorghum bicolor]|uniref:Uncharacterized protein n=1 Tax=Sorghum bicolor TaxID=4558 RepID=A0A921QS55_SORBI|nr:hypothetical protein BDA96_06G120300 [Sorghum bicolor]
MSTIFSKFFSGVGEYRVPLCFYVLLRPHTHYVSWCSFGKVLLSREGFSSCVHPKCVGDRLTYMGDRQERWLGMG